MSISKIEEWAVPALQIMLFPIWIFGGLIQLSYWRIRNSMNPKGSYYNVDGTLVIPSKMNSMSPKGSYYYDKMKKEYYYGKMKKINSFEGIPVYSSSSRLNSASYENIYEVLLEYSRKLNLKPLYFVISYHHTTLEVLKDGKSITIFVEGDILNWYNKK